MTDEARFQGNRAERRAQAKAARRKDKPGRQPQLVMDPARAQQLLMETVTVNRWDAVNKVLTALFKEDIDGKTLRLGGLGGATGVITRDALEAAATAAVTSGVMLPQTDAQGEPVSQEEEAVTPEEAALRAGGVVLDKAVEAAEAVVEAVKDAE